MNRVEKQAQLDFLKKALDEAQSLVFINFSGLTVEEVNKIRREYKSANCNYKVIKNTLLSHAVKGTDAEVIQKLLKGPIAMAYSSEEPAVPAKLAVKFAKEFDSFDIIGGYMEGELLDEAGVKTLSTMPSKPELQGKLLATMLAVPQNMLRLMLAAPQRMLLLLDAKKRAMEEE